MNKSCTFCINIWLSLSGIMYGIWFIFHPNMFDNMSVYSNYQTLYFLIPFNIQPEIFWGFIYLIISLANLLVAIRENKQRRSKILFIITRGLLTMIWLWAAFSIYHVVNTPASLVIYLSMFSASLFNLVKD